MLILAFRPSIVYLDSMTNYYIYYISFFLCHWLSMANSFANPILYCFMSKSFRADLCDLFVCICTKLNICIKSCETLKENHHPHHHTGGNHHHHQQHYHHHNDYHDQQRNPLHYKSLLYDHPNDKIKIQEKLQQQQPQKPYNYCLASIKESNITNPNLEDDDNDIDNELIDPSIKKLTLCKQQHSSSSLESLEQIDQLPIPLVITTTTQSSQSSSELHRSPQTSSSSSSSDWKNKQLKFINCKHKFLSINSTNDVNDADDDIDVVVENIPVVVVEQQQQQASKVFAFFKLNSMSK